MIANIKINMGNSAFDGDGAALELRRVLQDIVDRLGADSEIVTHGGKMKLLDINGNFIGSLVISD